MGENLKEYERDQNMGFTKDSWQRAMMGEFYKLLEKWWKVPYEKRSDDAFWDEMIKDTDDFAKKYSRPDDKIAVSLAVLIISHADDQARGKGTLCEPGSDYAIEAILGHFLNGGGGCQSINHLTDAEISG